MCLKSNDNCPYKIQKRRDTKTRKPYDVKAEIGVMRPQAKELLEPPEAGRGKEGSSPKAFTGLAPLLIP